ncbi:MAG TPA: hypothetical protein VGB81_15185 [Devosia sp.]|jgi:hypothetical protein
MPQSQQYTTPWWVRWLTIALVVLLVVGAAAMIFGGGQHGPMQHFQPAEAPAD